jgi:hypothetical protein
MRYNCTVCIVFMDIVSILDYVVSNSTVINQWWIKNDLEDIVDYFKILSRYSPGRTEENHEEPVRTVLYLRRDSNWTRPEYKSDMLPTEATSVASGVKYVLHIARKWRHRQRPAIEFNARTVHSLILEHSNTDIARMLLYSVLDWPRNLRSCTLQTYWD